MGIARTFQRPELPAMVGEGGRIVEGRRVEAAFCTSFEDWTGRCKIEIIVTCEVQAS